MIIVLSPEHSIARETLLTNQLFANGLDYFHIRKYRLSDKEMNNYISGIAQQYYHKLVLHSHYHLADHFGINRLHFREESRQKKEYANYQDNHILSTSTHSIEDFNTLGAEWFYSFLSPVFASISKQGYGTDNTILNEMELKDNPYVRLIGLGGVDSNNIDTVLKSKADGVALLGSIWQYPNPVNTLMKCQQALKNYKYAE